MRAVLDEVEQSAHVGRRRDVVVMVRDRRVVEKLAREVRAMHPARAAVSLIASTPK